MEDWNEVRIQASIATMQSLLSNEIYASYTANKAKKGTGNSTATFLSLVSKDAVELADALVDELKMHEAQKLETSKTSNDIPSLLDLRLYDSSFSVKTISAIRVMSNKPAKDVTIGDLVKCTKAELLALRNFGKTSLREIEDFLSEYGLKLKGE